MQLLSRPLNDVVTLNPLQRMSRQLNDVTTLNPLQRMSRQLTDVATLISLQSGVATLSFSSSIHGCLTWSFCRSPLVLPSITLQLQLEFFRHDLNMNFHCCKGFTTSVPLILLRLSYCIASSASHISNAQLPSVPFTAKISLSLEFPVV